MECYIVTLLLTIKHHWRTPGLQLFRKLSGICILMLACTLAHAQAEHLLTDLHTNRIDHQSPSQNSVTASREPGSWPRVVVTSPPLHSLVAGIMGEQAVPELLFKTQASHHHAALKPSQLRQLAGADLLVWFGAQIERPIDVVLQKKVVDVAHWNAQQCAEQRLLPVSPDQPDIDPHGWLDVDNARCYVAELVERLSAVDPSHQHHYQANGLLLSERLDRLDDQLAKQLQPTSGNYMGYHNSFRYLLSRYGLTAIGELNLFNEQPPGLRQLLTFRQQLKSAEVSCLIADSSASRQQLEQWRAGSSAQLLMLDPMGRALQPGPELYFELLTALAGQLADCIGSQ